MTYSEHAVNRFVREVAEEIDREPRNADVEASGASLEVVAGENGRKLRDNLLTKDLKAAVLNAGRRRTIVAKVHATKPEVTKSEVAAEYPSYLTLDRSTFTLRLWETLSWPRPTPSRSGWKGWKLRKASTRSRKRKKTRPGTCPTPTGPARWPGQTIPPGAVEPDQGALDGRSMKAPASTAPKKTYSLGSAASHGCVRMAIPDVEELYDRVEVGTPIFMG